MATILVWDQIIFDNLNSQWTHWALDFLMPLFHWESVCFALLAPLALYAAWRSPGPTRRVLIIAGLMLLMVDQTTARILKPHFARTRPCHVLEGVRLLVPCSGLYGLPSGHAANTAAFTFILALHFRGLLAWLALLVVIVGYSRIYVGVHYPLDVLAGWLWGSSAGLLGWGIFRLWERRVASNSARATDG